MSCRLYFERQMAGAAKKQHKVYVMLKHKQEQFVQLYGNTVNKFILGFGALEKSLVFSRSHVKQLSQREVLNGVESKLLLHVSLRHLSKRLFVVLQKLEDGGQLLLLHPEKRKDISTNY